MWLSGKTVEGNKVAGMSLSFFFWLKYLIEIFRLFLNTRSYQIYSDLLMLYCQEV